MLDSPLTRRLTVTNPTGVNLGATVAIGKVIGRHDSTVRVSKGAQTAEATNALQALSLAAMYGEELLFEAEGPDAQRVLNALRDLFADNFGQTD